MALGIGPHSSFSMYYTTLILFRCICIVSGQSALMRFNKHIALKSVNIWRSYEQQFERDIVIVSKALQLGI